MEENIHLVSSEDDNVDTASGMPADTENEHSPPSPGADLDRFIRFAQTCQSFSQKFFLECIL